MPVLTYQAQQYDCREGESVLDALTRQGVTMPFSCRSGICQVCVRRCARGNTPARAQAGLRESLRAAGYFLPCRCLPESDLVIEPPRADELYAPAIVHAKQRVAQNVVRLLLEPGVPFAYRPGQFVNLRRPDGLTRSYSLASLPDDYFLELHVQRKVNGAMSNWIFDSLNVGDPVELQGPQGECCYRAGNEAQPLLMIGTGTGLAPLLGIARAALAAGHRGDIHLYHGAHATRGLYLGAALELMAARHPNLHYRPCVSGGESGESIPERRAHAVALAAHRDLRGWRVYLCGHPAMVREAQRVARAAGALPDDIHADPFVMKNLRREPRENIRPAPEPSCEPRPDPAPGNGAGPDAGMWTALHDGELLRAILDDFYARVYDDPRLSSFFHGVTRQRAIEKQYLFLRQQFTGEKVYFGDRPRNVHHWMVVSDELFDYRERLMEDCLRRHGLAEHLIERWLAFEESFRADIVKGEAWKRTVGGVEQPVEGFGEVVIGSATLCDSCGSEIAAGTTVRYHLRLGSVYCPSCMERKAQAPDGTDGARAGMKA